MKPNPYDAPDVSVVADRVEQNRSAWNLAFIALGCICAGVSSLISIFAVYAWCKHWQIQSTDGYLANSFPWNAVAVDLTWVAGYFIVGSVLLMGFVYTMSWVFRATYR